MSDTITLGKRRKDGSWAILVQPEKPFGDHLDAYRKIASNHPVSDEFSRVMIGKLNHSSPSLNLITSEEAATKAKQDEARAASIIEIVSTADIRQQEQADQIARDHQEERDEAVREKNQTINKIRRETWDKQSQKLPPAKSEK